MMRVHVTHFIVTRSLLFLPKRLTNLTQPLESYLNLMTALQKSLQMRRKRQEALISSIKTNLIRETAPQTYLSTRNLKTNTAMVMTG